MAAAPGERRQVAAFAAGTDATPTLRRPRLRAYSALCATSFERFATPACFWLCAPADGDMLMSVTHDLMNVSHDRLLSLQPGAEVSVRVSPPETGDPRVLAIQPLEPASSIVRDLPVSARTQQLVSDMRTAIHQILRRLDRRFVLVVGPCSIHDPVAALEYAQWLRSVSARVEDRLLIVMRVYTTKPRSQLGWKGLINDPSLDGRYTMNEGVRIARQLMCAVSELGLPIATEFVDPITPQYLADLVSWGAIGARTAESQPHRELASGLSCPVGFKNSTTGDVAVAINGVATAAGRHQFMGVTKSGQAAIISTKGNDDCHVILRGGATPNYDPASVNDASAKLRALGHCDRVMIDCSHGNCQGDFHKQVDVARAVCADIRQGCDSVFGVMIESNLVEGRQPFSSPRVYGQSVTDACLGIADTERVIRMFAEEIA
jgi:3-deoxy-7-phosphoheptulonate synthase